MMVDFGTVFSFKVVSFMKVKNNGVMTGQIILLCTSYTTCFGPYWWPSSGGFVTKKNSAIG
jgi:hypothetical protein